MNIATTSKDIICNSTPLYEFVLKNRTIVIPYNTSSILIEKSYTKEESIIISGLKIDETGKQQSCKLNLNITIQNGPKLCIFKKFRATQVKKGYRRKLNLITIKEIL